MERRVGLENDGQEPWKKQKTPSLSTFDPTLFFAPTMASVTLAEILGARLPPSAGDKAPNAASDAQPPAYTLQTDVNVPLADRPLTFSAPGLTVSLLRAQLRAATLTQVDEDSPSHVVQVSIEADLEIQVGGSAPLTIPDCTIRVEDDGRCNVDLPAGRAGDLQLASLTERINRSDVFRNPDPRRHADFSANGSKGAK
jgi:hypothetical protein